MESEKQMKMNPLYPAASVPSPSQGPAPTYPGQPITIQLDSMSQMANHGFHQVDPQNRPQTAVILVNTNAKPALGMEPQRLTCPNCNTVVLTHVQHRAVLKTHLIAGILCITGLFFLAPLPYCLNTFKKLYHYCSNCNQFIGKGE